MRWIASGSFLLQLSQPGGACPVDHVLGRIIQEQDPDDEDQQPVGKMGAGPVDQ